MELLIVCITGSPCARSGSTAVSSPNRDETLKNQLVLIMGQTLAHGIICCS